MTSVRAKLKAVGQLFTAISLLLLCPRAAQAQEVFEWANPVSGDWGTNALWNKLSDADDDGDSDGADLLAWQRQLGSGSAAASPSLTGVPEPSAVAMIACAVVWAATLNVRRGRPERK